MPRPINILYTANLGGDLALLPRLFTHIRSIRARLASEVYLFDLGGACAPNWWHCEATEGRSMWVALDGMGYDAANAVGAPADVVDKLGGMLNMTLVGVEGSAWRADGIVAVAAPVDATDAVQIIIAPAPATRVTDNVVTLREVQAGQIGHAKIMIREGQASIQEANVFTMPPDTLPDPTIAGVVDFILAEARQAQKKRGSPPTA